MAFSLSNLWYLLSWRDVQISSRKELDYFAAAPPTHTLQFATVLNVFLLGALLTLVLRSLRCMKNHRADMMPDCFTFVALVWLAMRAFTVSALVALFGPTAARCVFAFIMRALEFLGPQGFVLIIVALMAGILVIGCRFPRAVIETSRAIVLVLSPLVVMNFGQVLWNIATSRGSNSFRDHELRAVRNHASPRAGRFVWLVFDELDERFVFQHRPAEVDMSEFDRFRSTALVATRATAPARNTLESLPSLVLGEVVAKADPVGPDELALTLSDGRQTMWSRQPNVFRDAQSLGLDSAVTGWLHPYCRVISDSLSACFCHLSADWAGPASEWKHFAAWSGLWKTLTTQARRELLGLPSVDRFDGRRFTTFDREVLAHRRATHRRVFEEIRRKALQFVANPDLDFVLVHIPVPHGPGVYDRRAGVVSFGEDKNYADNLALANSFLSEVRRVMQGVGLWESATIIVTSDHAYRNEIWSNEILWTAEMAKLTKVSESSTIPFLLKLPHQETSLTYGSEFSTIVTRRLLVALMRREIRTPDDVAKWLDRERQHA